MYVLCICKAEYAKQAKFANIDVHHELMYSESVSDTTYYESFIHILNINVINSYSLKCIIIIVDIIYQKYF